MSIHRLFAFIRGVAIAVAAVLATCVMPATAQPLSTIPGLSPVQQPTATAVNTLCPAMAQAGIVLDPNGTPVQRLFASCTALILTAAGSPTGGLGISTDQLRLAIQEIAPVQNGAQKQMTVESARLNLVNARLLDLRAGRQGFTVSGNGVEQPAQSRTRTAASAVSGKGGGAAADAPLGGPLGGFLNVAYSWGDVDQTDVQEPYKYHNYTVVGGLDYRVSPEFVVGGAISYSDTRSNFEQNFGNVKARTTSFVGYGTYYVGVWYVDGFASYGDVKYDSVRNIVVPSNNPAVRGFNTSARSSPKGDEWSAALGIGRTFALGGHSFAPVARLTYIRVKNKAFTEDEPNSGLGLSVSERSVTSLQSAIGGRLSTAVSTTFGVVNPYLNAQWVHEFRNDSPSIISKYVNDPFSTAFAIPTARPTRDYGVLAVGATGTFPNDLAAFAQIGAAVGLRDQTNFGIVVGVRKQF